MARPPTGSRRLKAKAKIERVSNVLYVGGSELRAAIEPLLTEPKVRSVLTAFRINKFVSFGDRRGTG